MRVWCVCYVCVVVCVCVHLHYYLNTKFAFPPCDTLFTRIIQKFFVTLSLNTKNGCQLLKWNHPGLRWASYGRGSCGCLFNFIDHNITVPTPLSQQLLLKWQEIFGLLYCACSLSKFQQEEVSTFAIVYALYKCYLL